MSKWSISGKNSLCYPWEPPSPVSPHPALPTDLMLIASSWLLREKIQTENLGWNWHLTEENVRVKWPDSTTFHVGNYTQREMLCFENKANLTDPQLVPKKQVHIFTSRFLLKHPVWATEQVSGKIGAEGSVSELLSWTHWNVSGAHSVSDWCLIIRQPSGYHARLFFFFFSFL